MMHGRHAEFRARVPGPPPQPRHHPAQSRQRGQRRGRAEAAEHADGAVQQAGEAGLQ